MPHHVIQLNSEQTAPQTDRRLCGLLGAGLVALALLRGGLSAQEPSTNEAPAATGAAEDAGSAPLPGGDYEDFKLVIERNIFDPNRRPRSGPNVEAVRPPEPKIDVVALTGTMSYAKGTFAFFDSTSSEFRKTARVGDEIAGYTVKAIEQSHVNLELETQALELKVGEQLRRVDEGAWEVTSGSPINGGLSPGGRSSRGEGDRSFSSRSSSNRSTRRDSSGSRDSSNSSSSATNNTSASSGSGEGPSDVLKRLLEQRRKEQGQ